MRELSFSDSDAVWNHIAPHLDDALGDLPAADRDALLLRFFKRKTAREVASELGLSEAAAQKRVTRALERLRHRFIARGIVGAAAVSGNSLGLATQLPKPRCNQVLRVPETRT